MSRDPRKDRARRKRRRYRNNAWCLRKLQEALADLMFPRRQERVLVDLTAPLQDPVRIVLPRS